MGKKEFINILVNGLIDMPKDQRDDIISQYEEHFDTEISNGKTEKEVIQDLGSPYEIIGKYSGNNTTVSNDDVPKYSYVRVENPEESNNYSYDKTNSHSNVNYKNRKSEKSILAIIFIIIGLLIISPGIFGVIIALIATLFSGIAVSLALTFSSIILFFGKILNSGHLKTMLGPVIDQIPMLSTIFFLIGNIALTILSFIIVTQIFKFIWKLIKKLFNWIKNSL